jgi:hypothetical protein
MIHRFLCHSFAILIALCACASAQRMEVINTNGTKRVVSASRAIGITIDGGGSAISTGVKGYIQVPFACTITGVTMLADVSGSAVVDVWKDTYANYPPTIADKITASAPPTISAAVKSTDTTLTGWTKAIAAGDVLAFSVTSASTITRLTVTLTYIP